MRIETQLINYILQKHFPDNKLKVRTRTPTSYMNTVDRITIEILDADESIDNDVINNLISWLNQYYTRGIKIGPFAVCKDNNERSQIWNLLRNCWIKVDAGFYINQVSLYKLFYTHKYIKELQSCLQYSFRTTKVVSAT